MREIKESKWVCKPLNPVPDESSFDVWLAQQTLYAYALAHADDGVVWGRFVNGSWQWSTDVVSNSPQVQFITLQQLRLFSQDGELFIWRTSDGFAGRTIQDGAGDVVKYFDESYLLWGGDPKHDEEAKDGFQPRRHGSEGLHHAPPSEIARTGRITTRNYIDFDQDGCARIVSSRLKADG